MRRRGVLAGLLLCPWMPAAAQDGRAPRRIGWLKIQDRNETPSWLAAFVAELEALGHVRDRSFVMVERYADGDPARLPALARELVDAGVSAIVSTSQPATEAAARVTTSVPIVGRMTDDPVANGMATSLAQPGRNVTGIYSLLEEMSPKRLALLQQTLPSLRRAGALLARDRGATAKWLSETEAAARQMNIDLRVMEAHAPGELDDVFARAARDGIDGLVAFRNPTIVTHYRRVIELSQRYRIPGIFDAREFAEGGALLSYGPNLDAMFVRMAFYVDRILKGVRPDTLPIEQPRKFELVINLKTARALGLDIPPALLAGADEVIE